MAPKRKGGGGGGDKKAAFWDAIANQKLPTIRWSLLNLQALLMGEKLLPLLLTQSIQNLEKGIGIHSQKLLNNLSNVFAHAPSVILVIVCSL